MNKPTFLPAVPIGVSVTEWATSLGQGLSADETRTSASSLGVKRRTASVRCKPLHAGRDSRHRSPTGYLHEGPPGNCSRAAPLLQAKTSWSIPREGGPLNAFRPDCSFLKDRFRSVFTAQPNKKLILQQKLHACGAMCPVGCGMNQGRGQRRPTEVSTSHLAQKLTSCWRAVSADIFTGAQRPGRGPYIHVRAIN